MDEIVTNDQWWLQGLALLCYFFLLLWFVLYVVARCFVNHLLLLITLLLLVFPFSRVRRWIPLAWWKQFASTLIRPWKLQLNRRLIMPMYLWTILPCPTCSRQLALIWSRKDEINKQGVHQNPTEHAVGVHRNPRIQKNSGYSGFLSTMIDYVGCRALKQNNILFFLARTRFSTELDTFFLLIIFFPNFVLWDPPWTSFQNSADPSVN